MPGPFDAVQQFLALRDQLGTTPLPPKIEIPVIAAIEPDRTSGAPISFNGRRPQSGGGGGGALSKPGGLTARAAEMGGKLQSQFPGLKQTSGYRDPEHNRRVGGVPNSKHTQGTAIDFVGSAGDMQNAAAWARANGADEVLVHNAGSGQHLHVSWG
jgi:hypothetical protein